jgi:hypothetical protein
VAAVRPGVFVRYLSDAVQYHCGPYGSGYACASLLGRLGADQYSGGSGVNSAAVEPAAGFDCLVGLVAAFVDHFAA